MQQSSFTEDSSDDGSNGCCDGINENESRRTFEEEHGNECSDETCIGSPSNEGLEDRDSRDEEHSLDSNDTSMSANVSNLGMTIDVTAVKIDQASTSKGSPTSRHQPLSAQNSVSTAISLGTNSGSIFSSHSIELELEVDLHTSWKTIDGDSCESLSESESHLSSQSSASFSILGKSIDVFVRDEEFAWLPAKVLEYNTDHALVAIDLQCMWKDSTISGDRLEIGTDLHLSMKEVKSSDIDLMVLEHKVPPNMLRKVYYSDYESGELPRQNTMGARKQDAMVSESKASSDLANLRELSMAAILYNLKERHFISRPYTRVGDILIAMNPFVWINGLYTLENRDLYSQHLIWNYAQTERVQISDFEEKQNIYDRLGLDPHVYEVSSLAYRDLAITGRDQMILVTGESGAGKTETVKILMDHLACVQLSRPTESDESVFDSKRIVPRVIQSSPVFEAFGNAKTAWNDNSSRFGKFIQLHFAVELRALAKSGGRHVPYTNLIGSVASTYLLEKNRVVFRSERERTFHIFYQLLAAPSGFKETLWPFFGTVSIDDFLYTAGSPGTNIDHEHELWSKTQKALESFKIRDDSLTILMRALGIVLQLGNLVFEHDVSSEYEQSTIISSRDELERLSEMMGFESDNLLETMTSRTFKAPNAEIIRMQLSPEAAKEGCDALAKEIYATIFNVVVKQVNDYTSSEEGFIIDQELVRIGQIAMLDIFGFEHFEVNRFEQLCINYCNEKLQGKYVVDNFNEIKDQYIEEGVDLYDFKLVDNTDTLHLLEGKHGVITMLNEECLRPKGNDQSFVYKVKKTHFKPAGKLISKRLHTPTEFGINHFAGCVLYDASNFVLSNMDKLHPDLIACAAKSTNALIRDEFQKLLKSIEESHGTGGKNSRGSKKEKHKTLLSKFQIQLKNLMSALDGTKIRYIRCIKPNKLMIPSMTDHVSTMRQMECSGLMTALIISKESYPQSLEYEFIMNRYSCLLLDKQIPEVIRGVTLEEKVTHVLTKWLKPLSRKNRDGSRTMPFACGKTKVFFKAGAQDRLEYMRKQYYEKNACTIQLWFRVNAAMRLKSRKRKAVDKIQAFSRMAIAKTRLRRKILSSTVICAWVRCCFAIAMLRRKRESALLIQTSYRQWKCRRSFLAMKKDAVFVQSIVRMSLARSEFKRQRDAVALIISWLQSCWHKKALKVDRNLKRDESREEHRAMPVFGDQGEKEGTIRNATLTLESNQAVIKTVHDVQTIGSETFETTTGLVAQGGVTSKDELEVLKKQIAELNETNNGLTKEVFRLRHEKEQMRREHQSTLVQLFSKLSVLQEELESTTKTNHNEKLRVEKEMLLLENKHTTDTMKLKSELQKTRRSHQAYLANLMGVLQTSQMMWEEETAKISRELIAIKDEKDNKIILLRKEIEALRRSEDNAKSLQPVPSSSAQGMKEGVFHEREEDTKKSERFNDIADNLETLITEYTIPSSVNEDHYEPEVLTRQEQTQKMIEMIGLLKDIFQKDSDR